MEQLLLTYLNIDTSCEKAEMFLQKANVDRREGLRIKLMLEEVLLNYRDKFGEEAEYKFRYIKRFFSQRIEIIVEGEAYNPFEGRDIENEVIGRMLAGVGLAPTWNYKNGKNHIVFLPKKKPLSQMKKILISSILAIIMGGAFTLLPDSFVNGVSSYILTPVTDKFVGLLSAVSGPMIFLSILGSICNMGDLETLGKIGKKTIFIILGVTFLTSVYSCLVMTAFSTLQTGGGGSSDISGVLDMVYGIVPGNLFAPFTEGNVLQIIFVAVVCGIAMLILAGRVPQITSLIEQLNMLIQTIMEGIASLLYVLVFALLLNMIVSGKIAALLKSYKIIIWSLILLAGFMLLCLMIVSVHQKVSPGILVKKITPTFLIGFMTASSAAAFTTNVHDAEKKLGMDGKFVRFGIPLGQIIFKPGFITELAALEFGLAKVYDLQITFSWIVIACIVNFIMSVAVPPIPGGALACYTIIFTQLGIPADAIAVAFALDMILDFPGTGIGISSLQLVLVEVADSLKMIRKETLKM